MLESLERLTRAVEAAGTDIAPTYAEYVQLAFAVATDCGDSEREYFHRLCALSPKYQRENAERMFSEALKSGRGDVHLGTAFHLATLTGVCVREEGKVKSEEFLSEEGKANSEESSAGSLGSLNREPSHTLTRAHTRVMTAENCDEELIIGSEPLRQLPYFGQYEWPEA